VLTPPKGLGTIFALELRFLRMCATLAEDVGLSRIILIISSNASFHS